MQICWGVLTALMPAIMPVILVIGAGMAWRRHPGAIGRFFYSPLGVAGLAIILFWIFVALCADFIASFGPLDQFAAAKRAMPGFVDPQTGQVFLLGGDNLGRDVFSRTVYGTRFVLLIAPAATLLAYVVGISLALPAAYFGRLVDFVPTFIANLVLAFPVILLFYLLVTPGVRETAIPGVMMTLFLLVPVLFFLVLIHTRLSARPVQCRIFMGALLVIAAWLYCGLVFDRDPLGLLRLEPNELNIFAAVIFYSSPAMFRIVRGLALDVKSRDYVAAALTRSESAWYIMLWEILPNVRGPIIVDACLRIGYTTILLGTLGFFGLGLSPESPDWGSMIDQSRRFIRIAPTMVLPPTLALASLVLGLNMLADGLREASAGPGAGAGGQ